MRRPVLIIGGGLSGLAAAIRLARFGQRVLIIEKHSRLGGLNSYFYRNRTLFETGLHAITNYAPPNNKKAPLNRLLRQLKLKRAEIGFCEQRQSKIFFRNCETLHFSNDFELIESEISAKFPASADKFQEVLRFLAEFDAFKPTRFHSARTFLEERLQNQLLVEMLLCPLMYYGSSHENDMDLGQFAIMFRAIFQEGMFRPKETIKEFLDLLAHHFKTYGGEIQTNCAAQKITQCQKSVLVELSTGEELECSYVLSTIGREETSALLGTTTKTAATAQRLAFAENIYQLPAQSIPEKERDTTIIFFNTGQQFEYAQPQNLIDTRSGVICFPSNFNGIKERALTEVRSTHLANYQCWKKLSAKEYSAEKQNASRRSLSVTEEIIGSFSSAVTFNDMFTPLTIERYTSKIGGAIYGHPNKIKDGNLGLSHIFLAGTDQGFLGIVGSMLSGVSIVNQHILPKL